MIRTLARSGLASLDDLELPETRALFAELEKAQDRFLKEEHRFRGPKYKWPADALHWWSRVWEYPYVLHHIRKWQESSKVTKPVVVDLGCGVTFFPFVVAQAGCEVIAVDIDAVVGADFVRAIEVFRDWTRLVTFRPCDRARLPFDDETVDALYCVSVLEHIPDFSATISEIARVLKPKGLLLLTIDVDLSGNSELSPGQYWMLRDALEGILELVEPEVTVHPLRVLDSRNSPYPMTPARTGIRAWLHGVRKEFKAWRHEECAEPYLTCAGLVFEKKARDEAIAT